MFFKIIIGKQICNQECYRQNEIVLDAVRAITAEHNLYHYINIGYGSRHSMVQFTAPIEVESRTVLGQPALASLVMLHIPIAFLFSDFRQAEIEFFDISSFFYFLNGII